MTPTLQPLPQALALFRRFDAAGVPYCHYKSNEHLLEGLAGVTDLDLLLPRRQAREAQAVFQEAGFKRFTSRFAAAYPAVEDYLGFDAESGRLIHAHVYYALVVGQKYLKGYQLGFDADMLAARVPDPATGVSTSDPSHEMLLLLVRYALKAGWRDGLREWLLGQRFFDADAQREHSWLRARLQPGLLHQIAEEKLGKAAGERVEALAARAPTVGELYAFRRRSARALARFRTYGPLEGLPVSLVRELSALVGGVNRRLFQLPVPLRRTHPAGGRILAFVGPDGSGKSTVVEEVRRWLAWKLDVYPVYFGSGDGSSSLLRWPLKRAVRIVRALRAGLGRQGQTPKPPPQPGATPAPRRLTPYRALWAAVLAFEKRSKMRAAVKARNRGMLVVCDRYPQIQTLGFNDGPLLAGWLDSPSRWRQRLAHWEFETYRELTLTAPDLLVKMDVTPEESRRRKPDTAPGEVERRRIAVRKIDYGPDAEILEVDATRPLSEVLLRVKQAIWTHL